MILLIVYLVIFALDILLVSDFKVLGMGYIVYYQAGSSLVYCIFLNSYAAKAKKILLHSSVNTAFITLNTAIAVYQFLYMVEVYTNNINRCFVLNTICEAAFAFISFILAVLFTILKITRINWIPGIFIISLLVTFIKYGLQGFIHPMPILLFRYSGILDLVLIFTWFRILFLLIDQDNRDGIPQTSENVIS